jgi:hypothetical protein
MNKEIFLCIKFIEIVRESLIIYLILICYEVELLN